MAKPTIIDYTTTYRAIDGSERPLSEYQGKVLLVVNTASKCGYTPQYDGLEALWQSYRDQGLVVLGFPCDQFGHQEPGDEAGIAQFCKLNFGVSFPLAAKIEVNGAKTHPLYRQLKRGAKGVLGSQSIKWNFTKFLVNRRGEVIARFAPNDTPESLRPQIEAALRA
jgi:glutathione peroxidase